MKALPLAACIVFIASFITPATAQTSIGLRLGLPTGITFKSFVSDNGAFEAFLGTRGGYSYYDSYYYFNRYNYRATVIGAAYQIHDDVDITGLELGNLQWYYGFGASVLFFSARHGYYYDNVNRTSLGLQGYVGLSYQLDELPLNFSLDIIPTIAFGGYDRGFSIDYGGLAIRYTF